ESAAGGDRTNSVKVGEQARIRREISGRLSLGPGSIAELCVDWVHVRNRSQIGAERRRCGSCQQDLVGARTLWAENRILIDHARGWRLQLLCIFNPGSRKHTLGSCHIFGLATGCLGHCGLNLCGELWSGREAIKWSALEDAHQLRGPRIGRAVAE